MSFGIGPHDLDCQCDRCKSRRQTFTPKCPKCGVSFLSYYPVEEFDDVHHRSRDGERPMIRCAELIHKEGSEMNDELYDEAAREIRHSIERQERQRARWPDNLNHAMSELARLFPTMQGVPGTDPWDVHQLIAWMNTGAPTTGSWWAAMFLLGVWNPHTKWNKEGIRMRKGATGKFDLFVAMRGWDQLHIDAAREWIANPFFP